MIRLFQIMGITYLRGYCSDPAHLGSNISRCSSMIYAVQQLSGQCPRSRGCRFVRCEQLIPCCRYSGERIIDIVYQNCLHVIYRERAVPVDISCLFLLFRQTAFIACYGFRIGIQGELCILYADLLVCIDITAQNIRNRRFCRCCDSSRLFRCHSSGSRCS